MRVVLPLFVLFSLANSLNIVVYLCLVGKSHMNFIEHLIEILVERGHNVDLLLARLNTGFKWENSTRARKVLDFGFPGESPWMTVDHLTEPFKKFDKFSMLRFYEDNTKLCKIGLESGAPLKFLQDGNYDAMLASEYEYCGHILAKAAGIETVMSYTATNLLRAMSVGIGLPSPVSCHIDSFDTAPESYTLWAKLRRTYDLWEYHYSERPQSYAMQTAVAREQFGPSFPDVHELARNADIVFVNSNEIIEQPLTISHKVQYIGGAALPTPKPVNEEFEKLLSKKSKGTVIFSFGTQVPSKTIPYQVRASFVKAFANFPDYNFLWKYEAQPGDEQVFANATNVDIVKWFPQTDLLNDGRVVAFITHMGLNSLLEASYSGVPMVAVPLFADQGHNAKTGALRGTTVIIDKTKISEDTVSAALSLILREERYRLSAQRVARMLKNKPNDMRKRFSDWVEFAAEHGKLHEVFNLKAAELDPLTYYCVDVVVTISLFCLFLLYVCWKLLAFILNIVFVKANKLKTA